MLVKTNVASKVFVLIAFFASSAALAADSSSGCGLGWSIFKDNSLVSSYSRSVTNSLTSASSGMTSGTSGCAKHSIVQKEQRAIHYVESNKPILEREISAGKGDYLSAFASVMGCASTKSFEKGLQNNFETLQKNIGNAPKFIKSVKKIISKDQEILNSCPGLS